MILDLRGVAGLPGASVSFDFTPDLSPMLDSTYVAVRGEPRSAGLVRNEAGALSLKARVNAEFTVQCARCLKEFDYDVDSEVTAALSESDESVDDPELYHFADMRLDIDEVIVTELMLSAEQHLLCRTDCRGLCPGCGADLNETTCGCKPETDPRLAELAKLLGDEEV